MLGNPGMKCNLLRPELFLFCYLVPKDSFKAVFYITCADFPYETGEKAIWVTKSVVEGQQKCLYFCFVVAEERAIYWLTFFFFFCIDCSQSLL